MQSSFKKYANLSLSFVHCSEEENELSTVESPGSTAQLTSSFQPNWFASLIGSIVSYSIPCCVFFFAVGETDDSIPFGSISNQSTYSASTFLDLLDTTPGFSAPSNDLLEDGALNHIAGGPTVGFEHHDTRKAADLFWSWQVLAGCDCIASNLWSILIMYVI